MIETMAARYQRPDWVRRLNAMAGAVGGDPRRIVPIDADELLELATRSLPDLPSHTVSRNRDWGRPSNVPVHV